MHHIVAMASKSSDSPSRKTTKSGSQVLGRSAATGMFVLKPASKGGSVSLSDVRKAVRTIRTGKK
jgi:hypothetical protein